MTRTTKVSPSKTHALPCECTRCELATTLLAALRGLIDASGHMSPFGPEPSVKNVRLAGKYMGALDRARSAIKAAEGK